MTECKNELSRAMLSANGRNGIHNNSKDEYEVQKL